MSFNSEYQELRKKRKKQEEKAEKQLIISDAPIKNITSMNDIAPVDFKSKLTTSLPTLNAEIETEDNRTWFQRNKYFDDGYDVGDVTKTILGTLGDVGVNLIGSIGNISEGLLNTGATIVGNVAGIFGNDEIKKETEYFIKEDKLNNDVGELVEMLTGMNVDELSVLGEKSDDIVQAAGQVGATSALSMLGVPWWLTTGVTTFGSESANALNQGATLEEATLSGLISAGAEILTEKISGGIKFGGKTLDDALTKRLAANVSNKALQTLFKFGIDAVGEGNEEILSGVMSAIGQKLTYADDKELNELFSSEDARDSFIGGVVLGGLSNVNQNVKAKRKGVDALSGLTTNEQAVFDKVYNETIAERESNGEKLTAKEKTKIYDQVLNNLEKGYISTDTIESVLGGDTYKQYQAEVDNEKALQDEFNTLNKMKQGDMTGEQVDRRNELKEQLKQIKESTTVSDLKNKLSTEVSELAKTSRLIESYNEKSRKSQKFEADLSQYDIKQQSAVKRAIDSGVLNNSNRTHEFVDLIAKLEADKGVLFDFTNNEKLKASGFAVEGKDVAGYVQGKNIGVNIDSSKALNTVVGHEITHILEGTELYTELQNAVKNYAEAKGTYNSKLQSITKLYEGIKDANIENELTAELVGEYLFSDTDFINNLSAEQPGLFKKIYDEVKYLCKVATTRSKEARQLEKVKKAFEDAYKQKNNTVADNGVKYSISEIKDQNNKSYGIGVKLDSTLLDNLTSKERVTMIKEYVKELGGELLTAYDNNGNVVNITIAKSDARFKNDKGKSKPVNKDLTTKYINNEVKQEAIALIDELVITSKYDNSSSPLYSHGWLDDYGKNDWEYWTTYIQDKNKTIWEATLNIANTSNGEKILYDIYPIKKAGQSVKSDTSSAKDIISNPKENVKEKQLDIINKYNPAPNTYNTWVRTVDDIKTFEEALADDECADYDEFNPDFDRAMAEQAIEDGEITVYSSYPIEQGVFVSPSYMEAESYSGDGNVYSKRVPLDSVAWIDVTQGQYADTKLNDEPKFSLVDGSTDIAPELNNNIYGEDIKLQQGDNELVIDDDVPIKQTQSAETTNENNIINGNEPIKDLQSAKENVNSKAGEVKRIMSIEGELRSKLFSYYTELHNNEINREKALAEKDEVISKLQAEYDSKKDKNSQVANNLLMRIEKEQRLKSNIDANYSKRISKIEKKISKTENRIEELTPYDDELQKRILRIDSQLEQDKAELKKEFDFKKSDLMKTIENKNTYISEKALNLYNEMVNHKKGEKVSKELGYFLDLKFDWNTLKSTLASVHNNPINSKLEFEKIVYEAFSKDYNNELSKFNNLDSEYYKKLNEIEKKADEKRKAARRSNQANLKKWNVLLSLVN